jgi:hypothetical protein
MSPAPEESQRAEVTVKADQPKPTALGFSVVADPNFVPSLSPYANLTITLHGGTRDASLMTRAGEAIKSIGADVNVGKASVPVPGKGFNFTVEVDAPLADQSGEKRLMHLSFATKELQQAVRMGADADAVLGIAHDAGWWTPHNDDVIKVYCADATKPFCNKWPA